LSKIRLRGDIHRFTPVGNRGGKEDNFK
ncbi:hypothetical protein ThvES_00021460, partial [Thiovulum sp. ES]